jgi:glycosyltransferase involved in cell wall biosynthesis
MLLKPGSPATRDEHGVLRAPLPQRGGGLLDPLQVGMTLRTLRPQVLHAHDPEVLSLFPALKAFVPRLVYEVRAEPAGGPAPAPGAARSWAGQAGAVAQRGLASLAHGIVVTAARQLEGFGGTGPLQLVLPDYPRREAFEDAEPLPDLAADPRLKLACAGRLSRDGGCLLLLDVMAQLAADEAVLYLSGAFADPGLEAEVRGRVADGLADRVLLLERDATAEAARLLVSADVLWWAALEGSGYDRPMVDAEIFEGMAAGLAVLATNLPGRAEVVGIEQVGLTVASGLDGHLTGVRRLLGNRGEVAAMGRRARRAVERRYSWEAVQDDLVDFYGSLCAGLH